MTEQPATPPPPGVMPNFIDPENRATTIIKINAIFMTLSGVILLLRLYSRRSIVHQLGFADYSSIIGELHAFGFSITTICLALNHGQALHSWDIPLSHVSYIMKMSIIQSTLLWLAFIFAKLSILVFYASLSPYSGFRSTVFCLMGLVVTYGLIAAFYWLFACQPISRFWDTTSPEGSCIDLDKFWYISGSMNSVTDFIMLLLPVWVLWPAPIPRWQKVGTLAIFMTGVLVCAASVLRAYFVAELHDEVDRSWPIAPTILAVLEIHIGLICGSLPHLKPLMRQLHQRPLRLRLEESIQMWRVSPVALSMAKSSRAVSQSTVSTIAV